MSSLSPTMIAVFGPDPDPVRVEYVRDRVLELQRAAENLNGAAVEAVIERMFDDGYERECAVVVEWIASVSALVQSVMGVDDDIDRAVRRAGNGLAGL